MVKLSISNIAWAVEHDTEMYRYLRDNGYQGLEIAPTRVFPDHPYNRIEEARGWALKLKEEYRLGISSMQSVWYGRQENIFGSVNERKILIEYTKQAICFAEAIGCGNLVFGCPRNRDTNDVAGCMPMAIPFFRELGDFALEHHTVVALEANPVIYNTRFMNTTEQAVEMACKSGSEGIKVNIDLGTIIYNKENIEYLYQVSEYINHVHISEPGLDIIRSGRLIRQTMKLLEEIGYDRFVSIEMKNGGDIEMVKTVMRYINGLNQ